MGRCKFRFVRLFIVGWLTFYVGWRAESSVAQVFDVVTWKECTSINEGICASGTANGIGFDYVGPNWPEGVTDDGSFTGFSDPQYHNPSLPTSDRIHIWNEGTFTFDAPISGLYIHMAINPESPFTDMLDFGIEPVVISGDVVTNGNSFGTSSVEGGLVFLPNINSDTLSFTPPDPGGECVDVALIPLPITGSENVTWLNDGTGAWHTGSNWDSGVPNLDTQTAIFGGLISSPATVTVDAPVTVKGITFDSSNTYAIAGTSNVNLDAETGDAALNVLDGHHQFVLPVTLNDDTVVDVAAGSSLSFNHDLNLGGYTLTKTGLGSLFINNQLTQGSGMVVGNGGVLGGSGTIGGDLTIGGILAPGKNSGILAANSSVVPEPTSLALIGLGLLELIAMAGRRGPVKMRAKIAGGDLYSCRFRD